MFKKLLNILGICTHTNIQTYGYGKIHCIDCDKQI